MKEGIRWLYQNMDDEEANEIVRRNAERYLGVEKLLGPGSIYEEYRFRDFPTDEK